MNKAQRNQVSRNKAQYTFALAKWIKTRNGYSMGYSLKVAKRYMRIYWN